MLDAILRYCSLCGQQADHSAPVVPVRAVLWSCAIVYTWEHGSTTHRHTACAAGTYCVLARSGQAFPSPALFMPSSCSKNHSLTIERTCSSRVTAIGMALVEQFHCISWLSCALFTYRPNQAGSRTAGRSGSLGAPSPHVQGPCSCAR